MFTTSATGVNAVDTSPALLNSNFHAAGVFATTTDSGEPSASPDAANSPASGFALSEIFGEYDG